MDRLTDEALAIFAANKDKIYHPSEVMMAVELAALRALPKEIESAEALATRISGKGFANGRDAAMIEARDAQHAVDKQRLRYLLTRAHDALDADRDSAIRERIRAALAPQAVPAAEESAEPACSVTTVRGSRCAKPVRLEAKSATGSPTLLCVQHANEALGNDESRVLRWRVKGEWQDVRR